MKNKINIAEKMSQFEQLWTPKVIAQMNQVQFKLVKIQGEFTWHAHQDTDEVFMVIEGVMGIEFRDRTIELSSGELFVVPKGVEHKPYAKEQCNIMIVEPVDVVNTGATGGELTAKNDVWI